MDSGRRANSSVGGARCRELVRGFASLKRGLWWFLLAKSDQMSGHTVQGKGVDNISFQWFEPSLSAASHVFKIQWITDTGTSTNQPLSLGPVNTTLTVIELPANILTP